MAAAASLATAPKTAAAALKGRGRSSTAATPFGMLQAKLALAPVSDSFERQADSAAAHVSANHVGVPMISGLPMAGMAQRACAACGKSDDEKSRPVQRKCACGAGHDGPCTCEKKQEKKIEEAKAANEPKHPEMEIDRAATREPVRQSADPLGAVERVVKGPGAPLPDPVRADMEAGFGRSFSQVRVHDGPRAAQSAAEIGAHAYTVGNHIAFNRGQYQPGTDSGRFLLAHELAHTVQQSGAPAPSQTRVSQPGDRHEAQANRAAGAALSGAAMPVLSPGGAAVGRYSFGEFLDDAGGVASDVGGAIIDAPGDIRDAAGHVVDAVAGVASHVKDAIYGIASAIGSKVTWDGTTAVINVPSFDPCPELEFRMQLSDLGLDPTLRFPIVAGALGIGIVEVIGVLGAEVNLDPGFGFKLAGCKFGPGQIRINALSFSPSISLAGQMSVKGSTMLSLGGDIGISGDLFAMIAWPDPPFVIVVPLVGLSVGGTCQLMAQIGGEFTGKGIAKMGLGGVSAMNHLSADIGVALDLGYGGYGTLRVGGQELCRVGWPDATKHWDAAARFSLSSSVSVGTGGIGFSFGVSATPMAKNPLDDLGFAFDESRLKDDCPICDFMTRNSLMPGQNGINWADPAYQAKLPRFGGPVRDVMQRNPGLKSKAQCRGTCGIDCPDGTCSKPFDLIKCREVDDPNLGIRHVWHTYYGYAKCGAHQGCKDHDACYDAAAEMPIWGFGGVMFGPMYRVCDMEALCGYSFKQAVTWAGGGGPYDSHLRYADRYKVERGCLGPCPTEKEDDEGGTVEQTCIPDRTIWEGVSNTWELFNGDLGSGRVYQGFTPLPYIGGVHYGIDAAARGQAEADAALGPLDLVGVCLVYDPVSQNYSGHGSMVLNVNGGVAGSITGELSGFLSDVLCLMKEVEIVGRLTFGVDVSLPSSLTFAIDLFCHRGNLLILPTLSAKTCIEVIAELTANLDFYLFGFHVLNKEWPLLEKQLQKCWNISFAFDPFTVGEMPDFRIASEAFDIFGAIMEHFGTEKPGESRRRPPKDPLEGRRTMFPCLPGGDDDDDDDDKPTADPKCPRKAKSADAKDHPIIKHKLKPVWPTSRNVSIPGGGSATVGTSMEAEYLTKGLKGGSDATGKAQKGIYKHPGIPTLGCFKPKVGKATRVIGEQQFIKGHLLNAEVGGPAEDKNLFPITAQANADHKNKVEQKEVDVVGRVNGKDHVLYYKVTVQNISGPIEIKDSSNSGMGFYEMGATYLCEVADYQFCDNNSLKRNPPQFVPITSRFVFSPSGGKRFDQAVDANLCKR